MITYRGVTVCRKTKTISHGDTTVKIVRKNKRPQGGGFQGKIQFRVVEALILGGGLTAGCIFDLVYGEDSEGGPLTGRQIIQICFCQWDYLFNKLGLRLHKERVAGRLHYSLVPIDVV